MIRCLLAVGLLLAGCHPAEPEPEATEPPPVAVTARAIARVAIAEHVALPATVVALPERSGAAVPSSPARVLSLSVEVGRPVTRGQVVATLQRDPAAEAEALKSGEAEALAARDAARQARLFAAGVASRAQLEQAQAALVGARADRQAKAAALRQADANARLVAPIAGEVAAVDGAVGTIADPTRPLVAIVDRRVVGLQAEVDAPTLARLRPGARARVTLGDRTITAVARSLDPGVDPQTQRGRVLFTADNAGLALRLGMFTDLTVDLGAHGGLVVPERAVVPREGGDVVYVVEGDTAHERRVTLGPPSAGTREVKSGLKAGERVVVEGAYVLSDGAAVTER